MMVSYSVTLTAEIEGALDTTSVIAVPSGAFIERPLAISARPRRATEFRHAVPVAFAHRRR
jgi:hypothetical protein